MQNRKQENKKPLNLTGANIRRARKNAGMSQEQLALVLREQQFEVSRQTISQMENGKQRILDFQLAGMAKALKVSVDALYGIVPLENQTPDI